MTTYVYFCCAQLFLWFLDIFKKEVDRCFPGQDIFCSIGISYGSVSGYFPKIGIKHYDLYGDAIVHATRYEAMRKHLFSQGIERGNIIIIQEKAYNCLSSEISEELAEFKLDNYKVRDDPEATKLFYKNIQNHEDILFLSA